MSPLYYIFNSMPQKQNKTGPKFRKQESPEATSHEKLSVEFQAFI